MKFRTLCVISLCAVVSSASAQPPLAERVPAQWSFYVGWSGRTIPFEGSMMGQLLNEPAIGDIFGAIHQAAMENLHHEPELRTFEYAWELASIAWQHQVAIAADIAPGEEEPVIRAALLIEVGRDKPQFVEHLDALVEVLGEEIPFDQASAAGVSYRTMPINPDMQLSFGFMETVFFAYLGPEGPRELLELEQTASLAGSEDFQRRMAAVNGEDVQLAFHIAAEALAERLGPQAAEVADIDLQKILTATGLDGVSAVAGTVRIVDRGMYTKCRIFSPAPHRGVLSLLDGAELANSDLAAVPADADYVWAGNISAESAYAELRSCLAEYDADAAAEMTEAIEQFEQEMELSLQADLLAPMGDTWVLASAPSYGGFLTGTLLTVELKDSAKFANTLGSLQQMLSPLLESTGSASGILTTSADRTEINYVAVAGSDFFLPVAPAWAVGESKFYLAGWPQIIEAAVIGHAQGALTESAEYLSAREKIQGTPSILSYTNTPNILRQVYSSGLFMWTMGANALSGLADVQARPDWLPALPALQKYLWPQISAVSSDEDGITFESYGSLPGVGALGSVTATPLTTAAVLPALGKARANARRVVSLTNLRGIGVAMHMYVAEHGDTLPPDLSTLVEEGHISEDMLTSPVGDRELDDGESDYVYSYPGLRLAEISNHSEFVLVYERPENYDGRGTNVLFADGHVERLDRWEFDQALRRTEEAVEDIKGPEDF